MWNLDDIYKGFNETYLGDIEHLKTLMHAYQHHVLHEPKDHTVSYIENYLALEETITKRVRSLYAYASLMYSSDVNQSEPVKYMSILDTILKSITKEEVIFSRYIQTLDLDALSQQSDRIKHYAYHLKRIQTQASYLLSESEEILLAKMKEVASDSWRRLQNMLTANLKVSYRDQMITLSEVRNLAYENDPSVRLDAYKAELNALESIEEPVALAITNIKREVNTINTLRGYKSPLEPTLNASKMSLETLQALISSMEDFREIFASYLKEKGHYLNHKDGLPFYDLFAPVGGGSKSYTYDEAKTLVLNAFYSFSEHLGDYAKRAFDSEWIDVYPRKGKVGGAFCSNQPQLGQSRILTNFTGSLSDVLTLAHELGHGFHGDIIKDNSPLHWSYPMPLAETASIFCEAIVNDYLLQTIDEPNLRLHLLENALQGDTQVIIDILSRYYFETELFNRAYGPIPAKDLKSMMLDAQKKAYQDGLDHHHLHSSMWLMKPHYYSAGLNFYNFPYAFGLLFGKGLFAYYKKDPKTFSHSYEKLLSYTTQAHVEMVAKTMQIDVTDKAFWTSSLNLVKKDILEVIALFKQLKK